MASVQPLPFYTNPPETGPKCNVCLVYRSEIEVPAADLDLCRVCLDRVRKTLKDALKALPPKPKVPRPEEAE